LLIWSNTILTRSLDIGFWTGVECTHVNVE
jgi:hypothetical protein